MCLIQDLLLMYVQLGFMEAVFNNTTK